MSEKRHEKIQRCCICGCIIVGYGNDPWPVKENGECCDKCNTTKVVPARLKMWREQEK